MKGRSVAVALLALGALTLLSLPAPASADSDDADDVRRPRRRTAEILLDMNDAPRGDREPGARLRLRKHYGLEYSHRFASGGGKPMIFSIQGPAMPRKRLGLTFELRF